MINKKSRNSLRRHRQARVRRRVAGTTQRPRLVVFRSLNHIYAQLIDDLAGHTLASASSLDKSIKDGGGTFSERAAKVGEVIGGKAQEAGISSVVFDRAGYKYHGRVKALADGARSKGLEF